MITTSQNHPNDDKLTISWRHQARRMMTTSCQHEEDENISVYEKKIKPGDPTHQQLRAARNNLEWVHFILNERKCIKSWVALMFTKDHISTQKTDKTAPSTKWVVVSRVVPESFRQCRLSYSPHWRVDRSNSKLRPRFLKNNHNSWNRTLDSEERGKSRRFSTHHHQQCDRGNEHPTKKNL